MLFRCKNCGGNVVFDPSREAMYCPHCDGTDNEECIGKNETQCPNCGAALKESKYGSSEQCEYCGSHIIFDHRVEGKYQPDLIVPFKIDKQGAVKRLADEFKGRVFTPGSFLSEATLEGMKGIYVPFWLYDFFTNYDYAGKGTKIKVWRNGNTEYTETSYYHVARNMDIDFEKVPIDASAQMPDEIMDLAEPYRYEQLEDFQVKYMSGFAGEIFNSGAEELEPRARDKMEKDAEDLMQETLVSYSTLAVEDRNIYFRKKEEKYALLPIWKYIYQYQGKNYDFYVNGQTGKVLGETPVSRKKVISYGATILFGVWAILFLIFSILEVV